jgi:copper(I)-binding protein
MRLPWPAVVGGTAVAALGAAGLIRGAMPQTAPSSTPSGVAPIVVTGAFVRVPVPPTEIAAAYFTVRNTTSTADRLVGVQTGAGATAVLHTVNADGSMSASPSAVIPPHGSLVLTTGKAHVMIEQLFGKLVAGQTVNIELDFQNAGEIDLVAPVIGIGQEPPTGDPVTPSGAPS